MKLIFKILVVSILYLNFSQGAIASSNPPTENTENINAEELVKKTERAVAFIVKSGQSTKDKNLQRNNKASKPFWSSVKKLNTSVEKLNKYLFLKDDSFHAALSETVTAKEEVITTYDLLAAEDVVVKEGIDKASQAIDLLYQNYSIEAKRAKEGAALTDKEREKMETLKAQNMKLQGKLNELETKVGDNKKMIKKLKKIRQKSDEVNRSNNTAAGFFFAMSAMNMINGWMWGCHWWWGPYGGWYPGFYYGYVDIYVHVFDDYAYDWGYLDGVIDGSDYELEVALDQMDLDYANDYMEDIDYAPESYDSMDYQLNDMDQLNDGFDAIDQNDLNQDYEIPEAMDQMQPQMDYDMIDDYPVYDDIDYMDIDY